MLNKVILMGRLTRDPEIRYTQNNTPVASYSIAVDRNYSKAQDKQTDFIDIVSWNKSAEFVSKWFKKGSLIVVVGRLQVRKWQDKDGNNRISYEVISEEVSFGGSKNDSDSDSSESHANATVDVENAEDADDDGEMPF